MRFVRWGLFAAVAVGFFVAAINNDVYNLTSPPALSWHVLLRKVYSVAAFAIVGGSLVWASGSSLRTTVLAVAAYSGAIEVAQYAIAHSHEGLGWNAVDVVCGAVGGAFGSAIPGVRAR